MVHFTIAFKRLSANLSNFLLRSRTVDAKVQDQDQSKRSPVGRVWTMEMIGWSNAGKSWSEHSCNVQFYMEQSV